MTAAACGVNVDDGGGEGPIAGAAGAVPVAPPAKACSSATAWGLGGAAAGACVPAAFWARAAKTADCEVAAPPVPVAPAASCARIAAACGLGAGAGGGVVATTGPGTAAVGIGAVGSAGGAAGGKATGAAPWAGSPGGAPTASPPNGCGAAPGTAGGVCLAAAMAAVMAASCGDGDGAPAPAGCACCACCAATSAARTVAAWGEDAVAPGRGPGGAGA